jgi:flagellar protein FlgJ
LIERQLARSTRGRRAGRPAGASPLEALQQSLLAATARRSVAERSVPAAGRRVADAAASLAAPVPSAAPAAPAASSRPRAFVDRVWPHAVEAAAATGVPAHFLVAQSALESGWGKREIKAADGSPTFNLLGIKAGRRWTGATVDVQTTEFVNGVAQSVRAKFRAYASYAEAFRDYASVLSSNPRYAGVIGQQDGVQFARSLQQAGYATDPMYADKLARVIGGRTLRQALAAA